MKISLNWLKTYVPVQMDVNVLAEALTMRGLEVEALYESYEYLKSVVVGRVVSISDHPNAAKLKHCMVDSGKALISVVCGAPNVHLNCLSALALPGTRLPDGSVLEKNNIRGIASDGMLCSYADLGLGSDESGIILLLDSSLAPGDLLTSALNLSDTILEIGLTPNRSDCLSFMGIAREVAAIQRAPLSFPAIKLSEGIKNIRQMTSVTIEAPSHCPRYAARILKDVTVGSSPFWLQDRLISVGIRPINNVVDITNFVMMETGQPLHAFDFDRLSGQRIVVRTAFPGEKFTTLDHKERTLTSDTLMICDGEKPVAIAGVMGGYNSEIESSSRNVLIESACFEASGIRKTSKAFALNTDASHRFERGVDPEGTVYALDRAAFLMAEICKGTLVEGRIDERPVVMEQKPLILSAESANRLLGTSIEPAQMDELLRSIGFMVEPLTEDERKVFPPSFRVDISRSVDLVEEIARLSGYESIPVTFPVIKEGYSGSFSLQNQRELLLRSMTGLGFSEIISYSFVHPQTSQNLRLDPDDFRVRSIRVLNPLAEDQSVMRTSLIPGLLGTVHRNISQQSRSLKIFEIGNVFISNGYDVLPDEIEMLAGLWTGLRHDVPLYSQDAACDFYDLKGAAEAMLSALHIKNPVFTKHKRELSPYLKPGYSASILCNQQDIGHIGQVHPETVASFNIKQQVFVFELDIKKLFSCSQKITSTEAIPRFPAVTRDITMILSKRHESARVIENVSEMNEPMVERIILFDVFEGGQIPQDKKSLSFRLTYRSDAGTLEDETVNDIHKSISERLINVFDASLP